MKDEALSELKSLLVDVCSGAVAVPDFCRRFEFLFNERIDRKSLTPVELEILSDMFDKIVFLSMHPEETAVIPNYIGPSEMLGHAEQAAQALGLHPPDVADECGRSEGDIFAPVHRALRRGRVASALRLLLDDAGRLHPRFGVDRNHAWYLVGDGHYRRREFHEAIRAFRRALASDPADGDAMMALANCHSELGKPRWSRHYLTQALRLAPGNPALLYNLGNAWFDSGEFATAIGLYRRAAKRAAPELETACRQNEALARQRMRGAVRSRREMPGERR